MEFVIVESNQAFIADVEDALQNSSKQLALTASAREIADSISRMEGIYTRHTEAIPENPLHIFINIEGNMVSAKRQQQKEVDIIIWLRCAYKVANPIIIYSFQSNSQLLKQKPENLVINSDGCHYVQLPFSFSRFLNKKLKGVSKWHKLKQFLLPAFNAEKLRHREANKWGLLKLQYAHRLVSDLSPEAGHSLLAEHDSIEELIFHFFYNDNAPVGLQLQHHREKYEKKYKPFFSGKKHKKFTILVIDDYVKWRDLYKEIFQCEIIERNPNDKGMDIDKLEEFKQKILNTIDTEKPDLVLLDLRLYEELTPEQDPHNYSGARILKAIKEKHLELPVIITTASNKVHNFKVLNNLGCDCIWTKEGIDLKYTRESSLLNYFELVDNVYRVASRYQSPVKKMITKTDREIFYLNGHFDKHTNIIEKVCQSFEKYNMIIADETILSDLQYLPAIYLLLKLSETSDDYRKMRFSITKEILSDFFHHSLNFTNSINEEEQKAALIKEYILTKFIQWGCARSDLADLLGVNNNASAIKNTFNGNRGNGAPALEEPAFSLIQKNIRVEIGRYCSKNKKILLLSNNKQFHNWVNDYVKQEDASFPGNVTCINGDNLEKRLQIRKLVQPGLEMAATILPGE